MKKTFPLPAQPLRNSVEAVNARLERDQAVFQLNLALARQSELQAELDVLKTKDQPI